MTEIKILKFDKTIVNDIDSFTVVTDFKAFLDEKRVGFVRVTSFHTEDMEGRTSKKEVVEEKQLDSEAVRASIYQSICFKNCISLTDSILYYPYGTDRYSGLIIH